MKVTKRRLSTPGPSPASAVLIFRKGCKICFNGQYRIRDFIQDGKHGTKQLKDPISATTPDSMEKLATRKYLIIHCGLFLDFWAPTFLTE